MRIYFLLLFAFLMACTPGIPKSVRISVLPKVSLESQGLDTRYWQAMQQEMAQQKLPIDGVAVGVNQVLVAETYLNGYQMNTPHDLRSATKSITSLLAGIAIDQGLLQLEAKITNFFPDYKIHSSWREVITVRHLLTMSSGLDCNDSDSSSTGHEEHMYSSQDWLLFFFAIPRRDAPHLNHSYCTAGVVLLGEIVARATKMPLSRFAQQFLFDPLEITEAHWEKAPKGVIDSGGHLQLTPQSMLKIGWLMQNKGLWKKNRVVSESWIQRSLEPANSPYPQYFPNLFYGFLWWLEPVENGLVRSFRAQGNGGQLILVVNEANLAVAFTGHAYNDNRSRAAFALMTRYLIPMAKKIPFK